MKNDMGPLWNNKFMTYIIIVYNRQAFMHTGPVQQANYLILSYLMCLKLTTVHVSMHVTACIEL